MKLPPHALYVVLPTLFAAGLFLALLLVHGHPGPAGEAPFQRPF
jgi:hypothetical protein